MATLTFAEVDALLKYEPETGKLFWKERPVAMFPDARTSKIWNTRFAGKQAFRQDEASGYIKGIVLGERHRGHRVAWLLQTGEWPAGQIDHINGEKSDNRFINLREVSQSENQRNRRTGKNNTSGVQGVAWNKRDKRWKAYIRCDGSLRHLGYFKKFEDAVSARATAEKVNGFHPNHGLKLTQSSSSQ